VADVLHAAKLGLEKAKHLRIEPPQHLQGDGLAVRIDRLEHVAHGAMSEAPHDVVSPDDPGELLYGRDADRARLHRTNVSPRGVGIEAGARECSPCRRGQPGRTPFLVIPST